MIFGSVCSGIEAASVAWASLGWEAAWFSEIEPFPSAVLAYHYPKISNLGDMTKIYEHETFKQRSIDLLVGGTPANPSLSLDSEKDWMTRVVTWPLSFYDLLTSKNPDGFFGKTSPVSSQVQADGTLVPSLGRWGNSGMGSPTESWTLTISESPNPAEESFLSDIIEIGEKRLLYSLTEKALNQVRKRIPERFKSARIAIVLGGTADN